jgi:hypothetical protein
MCNYQVSRPHKNRLRKELPEFSGLTPPGFLAPPTAPALPTAAAVGGSSNSTSSNLLAVGIVVGIVACGLNTAARPAIATFPVGAVAAGEGGRSGVLCFVSDDDDDNVDNGGGSGEWCG